jgi:hypothetical protein
LCDRGSSRHNCLEFGGLTGIDAQALKKKLGVRRIPEMEDDDVRLWDVWYQGRKESSTQGVSAFSLSGEHEF